MYTLYHSATRKNEVFEDQKTIQGVTSVFGTGASINYIVSDYQNGGWNNIDGLDISDATVGLTGLGTSLGVVSNPVGWGIAIAGAVYFGGRLIYDLSTEE